MGSVFEWPDPNPLGYFSSRKKLKKSSPAAFAFQALLNSRNSLSAFRLGYQNTEPIIRYFRFIKHQNFRKH